jgi:SAM-dependent methyltransferase
MPVDDRTATYHDLHQGQLTQQERLTQTSARIILDDLSRYIQVRSVLDVGCGLGTWLGVAQELGIQDVRGIEGHWLDPTRLVIDPSLVTLCDLEKGFALGRRFDLAMCLEVGEHLSEQAAGTLVSSLAAHADLVLFSAAIPFQGGHHHVNERFPDYWANLFAGHGFSPVDCLRPRIWANPDILWWLRQNILVFAHGRALEAHGALLEEQRVARPLSVVHPDVYVARVTAANRVLEDHQKLINLLAQGGTFAVTRLPDGQLNVAKV